MANRPRKKRSRAKRRARQQHAAQEQTHSSSPESAGWRVFLVLVIPMSVVGWFVMLPFYMAEIALAQRCIVALVLGTALSALLTYVCNGVLQRMANKRRIRR